MTEQTYAQHYYRKHKQEASKRSTDWYRNNPERVKEQRLKRYQKNKHKLNKKASERYHNDPATKARVLARAQSWHHRNKEKLYGITPQQHTDIFKQQDGKCGICRKVLTRACVDHNHQTGKTRGLLCVNCNFVLGHAKDSIVILNSAIRYVATH